MTARSVFRRDVARSRSSRDQVSAWPGGPFLISTRPPGRTQEWIAGALASVLLVAFLVTLALRNVQLSRQDAYVPIANTIVCLNDLITGALLCAQFSVTRKRALLVLASGFMFKALILIPHELTFPGAFAAAGLLGARTQTTAWMYLSQHLVFLLGALGYTILRDREDSVTAGAGSIAGPIVVSVALVATAALLLTWLLTVEAEVLPPIMADAVHTTPAFKSVGAPLLVTLSLASVFVFRRRPTSMIDLWLQVAVWSWLLETLLTSIVRERFSLVFYVSRTMGVVSSSFVLIVFLSESLMLHRRLVLAMIAREQERQGHRSAMDVMVGSLAHELRQPLASILVNENAAAKMLSAGGAQLDEVRAVFEDIHASVLRANEIIESVRTMFDAPPGDRQPIDANDLVREAIALMHMELESQRVAIDVDTSPRLPPIRGHRGQLLEVLLNGLKNAIESLAAMSDRPRQIWVRTNVVSDSVSISIEDSGGGLDPRVRDYVFEPFYSTKPRGMGLGLSICQSIVSAHGGALSLVPGAAHGAVFRVELPAAVPANPSLGHVGFSSRPSDCPRQPSMPASER